MAERNPFTPAFGTVPSILAGRTQLLDEMAQAFLNGPGDPNLSSILVGARGTGKTVCLSCICEQAEQEGWISVSTSAIPGMLEDIYEQTLMAGREFLPTQQRRQLTSVSAGPASASWESVAADRCNWRTRMSALLDNLAEREVGLLVTVDEADPSLDEMVTLATVYQHFIREQRGVALVMAGLPSNVDALVSNKSVSFLRRAQRHKLGLIPTPDVYDAVRRTVESAGKTIQDDALAECARAIDGFPYMLQLVGYRCWQAANDTNAITLDDAQRGIAAAKQDFEEHVIASTYRELSGVDIKFLSAMTVDKGESRLAEVARRMGVTSSYASKYRARLCAAGVIEEVARGVVRFSIPGFREYVLKQEADR